MNADRPASRHGPRPRRRPARRRHDPGGRRRLRHDALRQAGSGNGPAAGRQGAAKGKPAKVADPALTVRYRTDTPTVSPAAKPWLEIIDSGKKDVALSDVKIRYYFTGDPGATYSANCVQAAFGCSNLAVTVAAMPTPGSRRTTTSRSPSRPAPAKLTPGQNSKGLQLQFFRTDHESLDQSGDRSFDPAATTYKPSTMITAYLAGVSPGARSRPARRPARPAWRRARRRRATGTPGATASAGGPGATPTVPSGASSTPSSTAARMTRR